MARGIKIPVSLQTKEVTATLKQLAKDADVVGFKLQQRFEKIIKAQKLVGQQTKENVVFQKEAVKQQTALAKAVGITKTAYVNNGKAIRNNTKFVNQLRGAVDKVNKASQRRGSRGNGFLGALTAGAIGGVAAAITTSFIPALQAIPSAALKAAGTNEVLEVKLEALLKTTEAATMRMKELRKFAAETPFELQEITKANIVLENLTRGALSSVEGMKLLGDAAAIAQEPIQDLAVWVGRAYDGLQSNRPIGEAMMRLQELGLVSGSTRAEIERLQKAGKGKDAWLVLQKELQRSEGAMKKLSQTATGLFSTFKDTVTEALIRVGQPAIERVKITLRGLITAVEDFAKSPAFDSLVDGFTTFVDIARAAVDVAITVFKAFSGGKGTLLALSVGFATAATNAKALAAGLSLITAHPIIAGLAAVAAGFTLITASMQKTIDNAQILEDKINKGFKLNETQVRAVNMEVDKMRANLQRIREIESGNRKARSGELNRLKRQNELSANYVAKLSGVEELTVSQAVNMKTILAAEEKIAKANEQKAKDAKAQADADKRKAEALAEQEKLQAKIQEAASAGLAFAQKEADVLRGINKLRSQDLGVTIELDGGLESSVQQVGALVRQLEALKKLGVAEDSKAFVNAMRALADATEKASDAQFDYADGLDATKMELAAINEQIVKLGGTAVEVDTEVGGGESAIRAAQERAAVLKQIDSEYNQAKIELAETERDRIEMQKNWEIEQERSKFAEQLALLQAHNQDTERAEIAHEKRLEVIEKKAAKKKAKLDEENRQLAIQEAEHAIAVAQQVANATVSLAEAAFGKNKKLAIAEALINTALGVTKALAQGGVLGIATGAAVAAAGVAQVANISRQNFARGGFPQGQNAQVTMNESGQEAVLDNTAVNNVGRQNIEALNRGANPNSLFGNQGGGTIVNEFYFSPTNEFNGSETPDIVEALRQQPEEFARFVMESQKKGVFANV